MTVTGTIGKLSSKGDQLGKLLDEAEAIHSQMNQLFIKNNVPILDLRSLPEEDHNKWQELHSIHTRLGQQMCDIILNKNS